MLVDPDTGRVGYVGRTDYPDRRWQDHWASKTPFGTAKERWLWSLYKKGIEPEMKILEEVPSHAAKGHEHLWMVRLAAAGARLTNSELPRQARSLLEGELVEARVVYENAWYGLDLVDYQRDAEATVEEVELVASGVALDRQERLKLVINVIRDLSEDDPKGAPAHLVEERCLSEGMSEQRIEDTLQILKNQRGTVYTPDLGDHYKLVRD